LIFKAVPALLSTLLHEQTSVIGKERTEIRWRRSQDEHGSCCVVSPPTPISFVKKAGLYGNEEVDKDGFFAYKLVFRVHLQTGKEQPWIYALLHCQRYVDRELRYNKRGNNITVLTGIYQDRLSSLEPDTTLVRLKASPFPNDSADWLEYLPNLLSTMGARPLANPYDIYQMPRNFWQLSTDSSQRTEDEYYIPYVEGYKHPKGGSNTVATGFGLAERSDVIEQTCCEQLKDVLRPDKYLQPDRVIFKRRPFPLALQAFKDLAKSPSCISEEKAEKLGVLTDLAARQQYTQKIAKEKRKEKQSIITESLAKTLGAQTLNISRSAKIVTEI